jgi:sialate O-acetylesterase
VKISSMVPPYAVIAVLACCCLCAKAEIRLPHMLSDEAVLQRDRPIHLWGWSSPNARISAHFHKQTAVGTADDRGRWSLYLQPEPAGGPYVLTLSGDGGTRTLNDILVGDVWLASGQSNMEFPLQGFGVGTPLKNQAEEIANANHPHLRLLRLEHKSSDFPLNDSSASWTTCTPETAKDFSAVAYFFGREISEREKVPIGLIDTTWGGTPADSWVSLDTLGSDPRLLPAFASRASFANQQADLDATVAAEKREDDAAKAAGKPAPSHPWHPYETSWLPGGLYNGMIAPLTQMTIKGFLWYQGETNSSPERAPFYHSLFSALIGDWRQHFAQGSLPFLFVQISSFTSPGENWGLVREQQRRTLDIADTAMVVTLDVGERDNVHPADKQTVGARLALAARATVYGEKVSFSGPAFREATPLEQADGTKAMQVWFDDAEGLSFHGKPASGFELAGSDHKFVPADSRIQDGAVLVSTPTVPNPIYVRYGWMSAVPDSLYNAAGLPASTFTSEPTPLR